MLLCFFWVLELFTALLLRPAHTEKAGGVLSSAQGASDRRSRLRSATASTAGEAKLKSAKKVNSESKRKMLKNSWLKGGVENQNKIQGSRQGAGVCVCVWVYENSSAAAAAGCDFRVA